MSYLNQVMLIGYLGKNPEVLRSTEQGNFIRLSLATTKRFTNQQGEKQQDTQWHIVYLNNRLGAVGAAILRKGDRVYVSGELRTREWFDDEGQRHFTTAIYARKFEYLGARKAEDIVNLTASEEAERLNAMKQIRNILST